jgi:hypothetical protein
MIIVLLARCYSTIIDPEKDLIFFYYMKSIGENCIPSMASVDSSHESSGEENHSSNHSRGVENESNEGHKRAFLQVLTG